ncbi:hypothetical protein ABZP36_015496 [Zizania latifolia]
MLPLEIKHDVSERTNGVVNGRKRKREDEEPTQSIMLPLEIKHDISERINGIVNRLRIMGKSVQGALQLEISGHDTVSKQWRSMARSSRLTTSIPVERKLYGRDVEKDSIVELLTKGKTDDLGVLPLVGVGGVGKTMLARFVYHDQRIKDHFDLRMWVCVSDNFNERRLTREMLELVCKDRQGHENITSFDALHQKLSEKIRGKRFLLVLDDMWEDHDRSRWDGLLAPLKHNEATGCMILATTRRPSVARMIGTVSKVEVKGLDEIEFWSLFKSWAFFGSENQEGDPMLQSIGKQIAKALKGSPLAARSVGALLNRSVNFEHWRKVQDKWKSLLDQDDDILAILKFSYEFLPVHLQHCFSYCSVFPKDHKFNEKKLVCAWISQNFVKRECHTEILEETGKQYLDNLVDWGFFEEFESHYLMHALAEEVSSNECATLDILHSKKISPMLDASSRANPVVPTGMNHLINLRHLFSHEKALSTIASVGNLTSLHELTFKVQDVEPTEEKTRDDVLEGLEPHQNLKHLQLSRYSGSTSLSWKASRVTSLQVLHLENCREWRITQSLEMLPVLRKLKLIRMWNLMEVSIPSFLEELVLVNMPKLEKCVGTSGIDLTSHLRVLVVKDCPQLIEFTLFHSNYFHAKQKSCFPTLKKLTIGGNGM